MSRSYRCLTTQVVAEHVRSDLRELQGNWKLATRSAADERRRDLQRHVVLVVATWLDEGYRPQLRCWLRASEDSGPIAVSVGYHPENDVGGIVGASLRHALIVADPCFRPGMLDVVDLCTQQGLRTEDEREVRRLQALGAVRFGAGTADLLAVLLEPGEDVDAGLARAQLQGAVDLRRPPSLRPDAQLKAHQLARRCGVSVVGAAQPPPPRPASRRRHLEGTRIGEAVTQVLGEVVDDERHIIRPTREELCNGFLIGRYPRCAVRTSDGMMSRVHALVIGRGDEMLVIDAGSTNGTFVVEDGVEIELDRGHRARVLRPGARLLAGRTEIDIVLP